MSQNLHGSSCPICGGRMSTEQYSQLETNYVQVLCTTQNLLTLIPLLMRLIWNSRRHPNRYWVAKYWTDFPSSPAPSAGGRSTHNSEIHYSATTPSSNRYQGAWLLRLVTAR